MMLSSHTTYSRDRACISELMNMRAVMFLTLDARWRESRARASARASAGFLALSRIRRVRGVGRTRTWCALW